MKTVLTACLGLLIVLTGGASGETPAPALTVSPITDKLVMITVTGGQEFNLPPYGTNLIASVGPDGILLVDAGFGSTGEALRDTLGSLGNGHLVAVINTHHHGDHTTGNQFLKDQALTIAHRNVLQQMDGSFFHLPGPASPNCPASGVTDSMILHFNGEEIHVVHVPPSHTPGDLYVYFTGSKVVAIGDLIFPDAIPYVDLRSGGSVAGYHRQVQAFITEFPDDVTFIGSHGRAYSKADMRTYDSMLTATTSLIRSAVADGKTAEQMVEENLLADWTNWNGEFVTTTVDGWIRTVALEESNPGEGRVSICEPLTEVLVAGSGADAVALYRELKANRPGDFDFTEPHLNMLGYQLMGRDRLDDALAVFALNVEAFPEGFNTYDSYGEALLLKGDTTGSVANYEKSLELNPDNANATAVLERLRGVDQDTR